MKNCRDICRAIADSLPGLQKPNIKEDKFVLAYKDK